MAAVTTTTITILRHAEKEKGDFFNPRLRHQDEPISANGRLQAERVAAYLGQRQPPIRAIYISAYQRTGQTAQPLAERLGLAPVLDERLNELDNGILDDMPDAVVQRQYPDVWQAFVERKQDFRFPQGETGEEARLRIHSFLEEKRRQHPAEHLLAVCHEGLIRLTLCHLLGLPVYQRWNFSVDFCGMLEISYQPAWECWKLVRFNHICT